MLPSSNRIDHIRQIAATRANANAAAAADRTELSKIVRSEHFAGIDREHLKAQREMTASVVRQEPKEIAVTNHTDRLSTKQKTNDVTLDDMFGEAIRRQDFKTKLTVPTYPEIHHNMKDDKPIAVTFFSDIHLGSYGMAYEQLQGDIKAIKNTEGMYVVHNGDEINNFIIGRLQGLSRHDALQPDDQWMFLKLMFKELAPKTLAATRGNHTDWTPMLTAIDYRSEICDSLSILDVGHGGKIYITLGGIMYTVMVRHKYKFESGSNQYNAVVKMFENFGPFDVGVIGHTHTSGIANFNRQGKDFVAIRPGSYKIHDEYAEEWGWAPAKSLSPTVILFPTEKRMVIFDNCQEASEYLKFLRAN